MVVTNGKIILIPTSKPKQKILAQLPIVTTQHFILNWNKMIPHTWEFSTSKKIVALQIGVIYIHT